MRKLKWKMIQRIHRDHLTRFFFILIVARHQRIIHQSLTHFIYLYTCTNQNKHIDHIILLILLARLYSKYIDSTIWRISYLCSNILLVSTSIANTLRKWAIHSIFAKSEDGLPNSVHFALYIQNIAQSYDFSVCVECLNMRVSICSSSVIVLSAKMVLKSVPKATIMGL